LAKTIISRWGTTQQHPPTLDSGLLMHNPDDWWSDEPWWYSGPIHGTGTASPLSRTSNAWD